MKAQWMSRTFWFNLLTGALAVAFTLQEVMGVLPPDGWQEQILRYISIFIAVTNIALRRMTAVPIKGTKAAAELTPVA